MNELLYSRIIIFIFSVIFAGILYLVITAFYELKSHIRMRISNDLHSVTTPVKICLLLSPYGIGMIFIPEFLKYGSWYTMMHSVHGEYLLSGILAIACLLLFVVYASVDETFPKQNDFRNRILTILFFSLLTGGANSLFLFLIVNSFKTSLSLPFLLFSCFLIIYTFVIGKKIAETKLIQATMSAIFEYRIKLIDTVLLTSFRNFEDIDRGRVLEILNSDTRQIGSAAPLFVTALTCMITIIFALCYMFTISPMATGVTIVVSSILVAIYYAAGKNAEKHFTNAKYVENQFMFHIDHLIKGFKELFINHKKMVEFRQDMHGICQSYRKSQEIANVNFINVAVIGNTIIMSVIGILVFIAPVFIPELHGMMLMSFVMVLLYIAGPIDAVVHSLPAGVELNVSWKRIQSFLKDLPGCDNSEKPYIPVTQLVKNFAVNNITFNYHDTGDYSSFQIGPISFSLSAGEVLFITGGNGSGKSTVAKLLTGLYQPEKGAILINGNPTRAEERKNYFSAVFSDYHLFDKMYGIDTSNKRIAISEALSLLDLDKKVEIHDNTCPSNHLSNGQKKRLALLLLLMEDRPVYILDEWAADQDPEFRKYFYEHLIPNMKKAGKIIIAITHDDSYFHCADKLIKLEFGQIKQYSENFNEVSIITSPTI
jgi:cyclic peptide transporter